MQLHHISTFLMNLCGEGSHFTLYIRCWLLLGCWLATSSEECHIAHECLCAGQDGAQVAGEGGHCGAWARDQDTGGHCGGAEGSGQAFDSGRSISCRTGGSRDCHRACRLCLSSSWLQSLHSEGGPLCYHCRKARGDRCTDSMCKVRALLYHHLRYVAKTFVLQA